MKGINRIITAVAVMFVLLCSTGHEARAQFVVSDPANLAQLMAQYVQDGLGWAKNADEIEEALKKYKQMRDDLDKSLKVARDFTSGTRTAFEIIDATRQIMDTGAQFLTFQSFFSANGSPSFYYRCTALKDSYNTVAYDYLKMVKDQFASLSSLKNTSGVDYLNAVKAIAEELEIRIDGLSDIMLGKAADMYDNYMFDLDAKANSEFRRTVIY